MISVLRQRQAVLVLMAATLVCLAAGVLLDIDETWIIDPDSAVYVGTSWSLLDGEGYSFFGVPHTKYPPLFPIILASATWFTETDDFLIMQCCVAFFGFLSVAFVYLLYSGQWIRNSCFSDEGVKKRVLTGFVFALLVASSIYILQYSTSFLRTETVFTAFSLASVLLALRIQQERRPSFPSLACFVLLFQCAYFTRMAGVALLGALILVFICDRKSWVRRDRQWGAAALLIIVCALGPILWMVRNNCVTDKESTDYAAEFTQSYGLDLTKNRDLEMDKIDVPGMISRIVDNAKVFASSCAMT